MPGQLQRVSEIGSLKHRAVRRECARATKRASQVCIGALVALLASPAYAFTVQSPATRGCHEEVTIEAWRRTVADLPERTMEPAPTREDTALIRDVPFDVPEDL